MFTRRHFMGSALSAATFPTLLSASTHAAAQPGKFQEPPREIPIVDDVDIIVCGGGPAGISAAVSAARAGASVRLMELQGSLGGIWTSGLLTYIFDFDKSAMDREIVRRLDAYHARVCQNSRDFVYEPEYMKIVCEEMAAEAGVSVLLHCPVVAAYRSEDGKRLTTIVTESKSGRQGWRAKYFIDCTGDGDLAAQAGCGFDMGATPEGFGQPATLNALVLVQDATAMTQYLSNVPEMWKPGGHVDSYKAFLQELQRAGVEPSYFHPTLFHVHDNLCMLMVNHEYKVRVDDVQAISTATLRARAEIHKIVTALNRLGGVWEDLRLVATAEQLGHRCGRRIHGRYTITADDVVAGRTFEDAVTTSRFGIDIHAIDFETNKKETIGRGGIAFRPFQIPLRSLQSKDVSNLFMAGRCISGDFLPHASYRVTGSAVAMGAAIGTYAAQTKEQ